MKLLIYLALVCLVVTICHGPLLALGLYSIGSLLLSNSQGRFCSFTNAMGMSISKRLKMLFMIKEYIILVHLSIIYCVFTHSLEGKLQFKLMMGVKFEANFSHKINEGSNFAPMEECVGLSRCFRAFCCSLIKPAPDYHCGLIKM